MCSPTLAIAAVGIGTQAIGAANEQTATNKALEYNAGILETNAKTKELQAINTEKIGGIQQAELKSNVNILQGSQRAAFGASGAVVDEGSAFDVIQSTEIQGAQDAMTLQYNIDQEAFGYRTEAYNLKKEAKGLRDQKASASSAAFGSLLGSVSSIAGQFAFGGGS